MREYPFLDHVGPIPFAHRGGAAHDTENSMAAFQRAIDLGYQYLETDVQATADGTVLAFHDRHLGRLSGVRARVAKITTETIRDARIGTHHSIPLLEDLLGSFPDARFNIDVKARSAIVPLIKTITRTSSVDRVCVASFSEARVAAVRHALGPQLATSYGRRGVLALVGAARVEALRRLVRADVPCVQVPPSFRGVRVITPRFVETAHRLGLVVHAWTIDDPEEINRLLDLGVDGIMSDDLITLRQTLRARGNGSTSRESKDTSSGERWPRLFPACSTLHQGALHWADSGSSGMPSPGADRRSFWNGRS